MAITELHEELGIEVDNVSSLEMKGAYWNKNFNLTLLFTAQVGLTSNELRVVFAQPGATDGELSELCFIESEDLSEFIGQNTEYGQSIVEIQEAS